MYRYKYAEEDFPAKDPYTARDITSPNFHLDKGDFQLFKKNLYVDLKELYQPKDDVDENFVDQIKNELNIEGGILEIMAREAKKFIFAGHIGSGKSVQLANFHDFFNHESRYFSIFISLEKELDMPRFETEDYFIAMIIKLAQTVHKRYPKIKTEELDNILKNWLGEKEISEELQDKTQIDLTAEVGLGINFLEMIKSKLNLKTHIQTSNQISTKVRTIVKKNIATFISSFNLAIDQIRKELKEKDILFVIDGAEKFPTDQGVRDLYIANYAESFQRIEANILTSIQLEELYRLDNRYVLNNYRPIILPIIDLGRGEQLERVQKNL